MKTIENLEEALVAAFPAVPIERSTIEEPTAVWDVYDEHGEVLGLEHKTWTELPVELLYRHPSLLVYAGDELFHTLVPAYLRYLLHERAKFNALPFQVAGQLTRSASPETHRKFDRRVTRFSAAQREAVRDVLALLATVRPMEEPMTDALATWNQLSSGPSRPEVARAEPARARRRERRSSGRPRRRRATARASSCPSRRRASGTLAC
jgi:hypothetical protein